MQTVIQKLSEIETAATRIMDDAAAKKKQMDQKYKDDCDAFDKRLDEETAKRLDQLRKDLGASAEHDLEDINVKTAKSLENLDREYEKQHEVWAEQIFNHLIRK